MLCNIKCQKICCMLPSCCFSKKCNNCLQILFGIKHFWQSEISALFHYDMLKVYVIFSVPKYQVIITSNNLDCIGYLNDLFWLSLCLTTMNPFKISFVYDHRNDCCVVKYLQHLKCYHYTELLSINKHQLYTLYSNHFCKFLHYW